MTDAPHWGLSATIKAPAQEILNFAAYHLDMGAHRLYLYLDDDDPGAFAQLKAHPKVRVTRCDADYWRKRSGKRPEKHQIRQTVNATHAYTRRREVDWLIHMDVDEFLWPASRLEDQLRLLDDHILCARTRPQELLAGGGSAYKGFVKNDAHRQSIVARLYPQFGAFIKGGFLSHVAGKLFVRTGMDDMTIKIHNVFQGESMNPSQTEMTQLSLCHNHAKTWEDWSATYRYRLKNGSYRAELAPNRPLAEGGMNMHDLFKSVENESGPIGLRAFFDEVCADTPELRARLSSEGLLRICDLQLAAKRRKHFPEIQ